MLGDLAVNRMGFGAMRLAYARSGVPGDRALGLSGISAQQLAEAQAIAPVVCVQNRYGLEASAADHTLLDLCGTQGIVFVPFFAIAGPAVSAIARAHDATPAQVRLAWTCAVARTCSPSPAPATPCI